MSFNSSGHKEFIKLFNQFTYDKDWHGSFRDFTEISAIAQHQIPYHIGAIEKDEDYDRFEEDYLSIVKKYKREELDIFAKLNAIMIVALSEKAHDFLGDAYQQLELNNKHNGEFFTPEHIAEMMARIIVGNPSDKINEKGYISIDEPACGSGVMLIGAFNAVKESGHDPRKTVWFRATDLNRICFNMCYIQLSQLGMTGEVRHGNTLSNEIWETRPTPQEKIYSSFRPKETIPVQIIPNTTIIHEKPTDQYQFDLGL